MQLLVASFGSELIFILAFAAWLLWSAVGAAVGRRSFTPSPTHVRLACIAFALALPASVVLARGIRIALGGVPGGDLPFPRQILGLAVVLLPVGLLVGLLFQWAAKLYVGGPRTLARAYAIESAGGLLGGILATLLLRYGVQNLPAAWFGAIVALVVAHPSGRRGPQGLRIGNGLVLFLAAISYYPAARVLNPLLTRWNHAALVATRDTPYGRITVTEREGMVTVFENDALAFESAGKSSCATAWRWRGRRSRCARSWTPAGPRPRARSRGR